MRQSLQIARHPWHDRFRRWSDNGIDAKIMRTSNPSPARRRRPATGNMPQISRHMRELTGCRPDRLPLEELLASAEPCVLRGLVSDWALTRAGLRSDGEAMDYIRSFYNGKTISASFGGPEIGGRLFYNEDFTQAEFRQQARADERSPRPDPAHPCTTSVRRRSTWARRWWTDTCRAFARTTTSDLPRTASIRRPSIWIGNRTIASCHYDSPNNIACCAVGRRRFTLFPPEQIFNLYPGPLEPTPGGQAISLVDFAESGLRKIPTLSRSARGRSGRARSSRATQCSSRACGGTTCRA